MPNRMPNWKMRAKALDDGIPITSVPRTLLDLAAVLDAGPLRAAVRRAQGMRLATMRQIAATR